MPRRDLSLVALLVAATLRAATPLPAADAPAATATEPRVVAAADAADHVGEECVVEMVVRAARALPDKDICFLNSRKERRAADNFTAVIFKDGLERFRDAGIENPALHFLDRKIRVRGVVTEHKDRPQIVVRQPDQIEIAAEPDDSADPK